MHLMLYASQDILPPHVPIISVSKGLELGTGSMMSELIPQALGRRHPAAFLSGPSFAKEVMDKQPTGFVAASKVSFQPIMRAESMKLLTSLQTDLTFFKGISLVLQAHFLLLML